jgi:hypothetical protein
LDLRDFNNAVIASLQICFCDAREHLESDSRS